MPGHHCSTALTSSTLVRLKRRDLFVELSQTHRIRGLLIVGIRLLANQLDQFDRPAIALAVGGAALSRRMARSASLTSSRRDVLPFAFLRGWPREPLMPHHLCFLLLSSPQHQPPTMSNTTAPPSDSWSFTPLTILLDGLTNLAPLQPSCLSSRCSPGCITFLRSTHAAPLHVGRGWGSHQSPLPTPSNVGGIRGVEGSPNRPRWNALERVGRLIALMFFFALEGVG